MSSKRNLTITLALATIVAGALTYQKVSAPAPVATFTPTVTSAPPITATPTFEFCSYVWASQPSPELTAQINAKIQALDSTASASAQFFGEDCLYADGHSTFGVMETDFYIHLPAEDLTAQKEFGDWIQQSMQAVTSLPADSIQGRAGFAEFWFIKSETESLIVRVPLEEYQRINPPLTGADLFAKFYQPPAPTISPVPITPTP
ncbi:MAG: hypothetical protein IT310_07065 [Anaerolineales bacterium]|nr:hypothetical protein [Anaerolineales bacterium]